MVSPFPRLSWGGLTSSSLSPEPFHVIFSDSFLTGLWPLGCVANRIGQPFHEDPWDFYHVGLCRRPVKSLLLGPQLLSHQRQSVGESRMGLLVPGRSTNDHVLALVGHVSVGEERDHREQSQQRRGGPPDRHIRPMPLRLKAQALAHLLECALHLPASYEPRDDLS